MPSKARKLLLLVALASLALSVSAAGFVAGGIAAGKVHSVSTPPAAPLEQFGLFWEVWSLVEKDFVGEIPSEEVVARGAARGLLRALNDPATGLIAPQFAVLERENSTGVYKGIGASVRYSENGYIEIAVVFEDSPALEAGLETGDEIVAIDGNDIHGMLLYEAVSLIRGPSGSTVRLTIRRPSTGELTDKEIERREIEIPTVTLTMLEDGRIAYLELTDFNSRASSQLREALKKARREGAQAVILDLRNNPGGFLNQAIQVADEFLDEGVIVIERGKEQPEITHRSHDGGLVTDLPLVVLVNEGSASASEIVAGAVQARNRGILVGEQTYGKGSVQYAFDLSDGSEIRVTTALWYTPDDKLIQGQGLEPDLVIENDPQTQEDAQLLVATNYLLGLMYERASEDYFRQ